MTDEPEKSGMTNKALRRLGFTLQLAGQLQQCWTTTLVADDGISRTDLRVQRDPGHATFLPVLVHYDSHGLATATIELTGARFSALVDLQSLVRILGD